MKLQTLSVVAFCFSRTYGAADGYVDLDGLLSPTGECVFDGDLNGYEFSCDYVNNTAVMYEDSFGTLDYSCSGSGVTNVTSYDYECTPVGFMTFDVQSGDCGGDSLGASTSLVTDICHESSLTNTNTMYACSLFLSFFLSVASLGTFFFCLWKKRFCDSFSRMILFYFILF